jgi:glucosyl-3-phosphoglycerate synthase
LTAKGVRVRPAVSAWFDRRTSTASQWSAPALAAAKNAADITVSVVLPALNEQETVGSIVATIRRDLMDGEDPLVDELVVIDSGSHDDTAHVASAAGAQIIRRDDVLPRLPAVPGKGEAMWRSLAATSGDVIVFIDADLRSFTPAYVVGLLGPLLTDPTVSLVKAMYERPYDSGSTLVHAGGGRVTELVARPLLNLHWPELSGVVQPLAGEYAARRALLERLPFPCGYGVEFALLADTLELLGLDAIAQVDLGVRLHRHHDERRLGRMAGEILQTAYDRLDPSGVLRRTHGLGSTLSQFDRGDDGFEVTTYEIAGLQRPPMETIAEYAATRGLARVVVAEDYDEDALGQTRRGLD